VYSGTKYAVRAISDGLRHEVGSHIRTTTIEPDAVDSELKFGSGHEASAQAIADFYKQAIPAESAARAIAFVCHALAALRHVEAADGAPLIKGRRVTGFTNGEEAAVELTEAVPFLIEDEFQRQG
jgi:NAD(P)-dependent dehydrogenase (short-subunit alcohol dehydrogenase family)